MLYLSDVFHTAITTRVINSIEFSLGWKGVSK